MAASNPMVRRRVNDQFVGKAREAERSQRVQAQIQALVDACYPNTSALIAQMATLKVPVVHSLPDLHLRMLMLMHNTPGGFVAPSLPRFSALVQALRKAQPALIDANFTNGVILLFPSELSFPYLAMLSYHALACQNGLSGYSAVAHKHYAEFRLKYKKVLQPAFLNTLSLPDSLELRAAIRRDREAHQFLSHLLNATVIPHNNAKHIIAGTAQA